MGRRTGIAVALAVAGVLVCTFAGSAGDAGEAGRSAAGRMARVRLAAHVHGAENAHQDSMRQCIQNCLDCHSRCLETAIHCQQLGGKHAEPAHLRLLLDCAEICQTSANFLLRGSNFHGRVCGVCANVCEQCARSCERFPNDAQMKACAASARRSAESCRLMAGMGAQCFPAPTTQARRPRWHATPPGSLLA